MTKRLFDNCKSENIILLIETKRLTDESMMACELTGINPDDLYEKYNF